jgi:hypothetical protein
MNARRLPSWLSRPARSVIWVALVFGVAYILSLKYSGPGGGPQTAQRQVQEVELIGDPQCDPSVGVCTAVKNDVVVAFGLDGEAKPLVPFPVRVQVHGIAAGETDRVEVEFLMPGMEMGLNRYRMEPAGSNIWRARVTLPVCTTGRTDWIAVVRTTSGDQVYTARFPFSAG